MRRMRRVSSGLLGVMLALCAPSAVAAETVLDLSGQVPDGPERHFSIPFDVPAGTVEIAVHQETLSDKNILDFGIMDPTGAWRGWGGSRIKDAVVAEQAATRSHVPGAIPSGQWNIVVGEAAVNETPAMFNLTVTLRDTATMPAQTDRKPYSAAAALSTEERWYAGDFHVHSIESNDAEPPLDTIATFAEGRGLDFAHISDHNIHTALDYMVDAQAKHPKFLFVPGVEYTTYWGHASAVGAMKWVDDRTELPGHGIEKAVDEYIAQGAFFSLNHPAISVGDLCIGCAWEQNLSLDKVAGIEINTGKFGLLNDDAVNLWDQYCDQGFHIVPLGGSDDHKAGVDEGAFGSPIGSPTTMVWAKELSVTGIMDGLRAGRTVVKFTGPADPMVDLVQQPEGGGHLRATVTGGSGYVVRWVKNGVPEPEVDVTDDPFVIEKNVTTKDAEERWRVEVLQGTQRRSVTANVWVKPGTGGSSASEDDGGCGCRVSPRRSHTGWLLAGLLLVLARRRRK